MPNNESIFLFKFSPAVACASRV